MTAGRDAARRPVHRIRLTGQLVRPTLPQLPPTGAVLHGSTGKNALTASGNRYARPIPPTAAKRESVAEPAGWNGYYNQSRLAQFRYEAINRIDTLDPSHSESYGAAASADRLHDDQIHGRINTGKNFATSRLADAV